MGNLIYGKCGKKQTIKNNTFAEKDILSDTKSNPVNGIFLEKNILSDTKSDPVDGISLEKNIPSDTKSDPVNRVFLQNTLDKKYRITPSIGIFPKGQKVNTQFIQKIEKQTKGILEMNLKKEESRFAFKGIPFVSFPNLKSEKAEYWRGPTGHPFFDSLFIAYSIHGEIALSPDDVWIQIASEFSKYIDLNAEELRSKIVTFDGKKNLTGFDLNFLYIRYHILKKYLFSKYSLC